MIKAEVGKRLAECRKSAGFTQQQVAKKLGVFRQAYARFENGQFELNYEQMIFLCKLFKCSSDYLLGLSEY